MSEAQFGSNDKRLLEVKEAGVRFTVGKSVFRKNTFWPIRGISFDVNKGESIGVIGRNGAGKSTLLRLLSGVYLPDEGEVVQADSLTVAMLALQTGFDVRLTGRENIILQGILMGKSEGYMAELFGTIHDFSELGEAIDYPVNTYSAGMRARLGFSTSYFLEPDILLIDEAMGVGDARFREKSSNAMKEKITSDQTVVFVSHNGGTVQSICDRAVWIENGSLMMVGTAEEVVNAYEEYIVGHKQKR